MSYADRRHGSGRAYDRARSYSTGSLVLATRSSAGQQQLVGPRDIGNDNRKSYQSSGNEPSPQRIVRDHRVQTFNASHIPRAIEWTLSGHASDTDDSRQVAQYDLNEYDGSDENSGNGNEADDERDRRDRRYSTRAREHSLYRDPPIAKFVRSEARRRSSQGRKFFSPASFQNAEMAVTRYGGEQFPLLPMPNEHSSDSWSQAAWDFANIKSGEFHLCVKFLRNHETLLQEDYHPYLQEAWKALWDKEKVYAHQCLSRWFLLDECRQIRPKDIGKHINQRGFSGPRFMDKVGAMYKELKTLRKQIMLEKARAASPDDSSNFTSDRSTKGVQNFFHRVDRATEVLSNVGNVYTLVKYVRKGLNGEI